MSRCTDDNSIALNLNFPASRSKAGMFDLVFYICDILAHCVLFALDLQFLYFCMVLCKRYRLVNKVGLKTRELLI